MRITGRGVDWTKIWTTTGRLGGRERSNIDVMRVNLEDQEAPRLNSMGGGTMGNTLGPETRGETTMSRESLAMMARGIGLLAEKSIRAEHTVWKRRKACATPITRRGANDLHHETRTPHMTTTTIATEGKNTVQATTDRIEMNLLHRKVLSIPATKIEDLPDQGLRHEPMTTPVRQAIAVRFGNTHPVPSQIR